MDTLTKHDDSIDDCPASLVFGLPELCAHIAEKCGYAGAFRLMGLCKAARIGAKDWLRTLPGLVVCAGYIHGNDAGFDGWTSDVWRLDLGAPLVRGALPWDRLSNLTRVEPNRIQPACCAIRGGVVLLGGGD
jgi:hypothetical protein